MRGEKRNRAREKEMLSDSIKGREIDGMCQISTGRHMKEKTTKHKEIL